MEIVTLYEQMDFVAIGIRINRDYIMGIITTGMYHPDEIPSLESLIYQPRHVHGPNNSGNYGLTCCMYIEPEDQKHIHPNFHYQNDPKIRGGLREIVEDTSKPWVHIKFDYDLEGWTIGPF
ncbi:MAG: hypothetical protein CMH63_02450 [Nanoarchaeota archaeon]|mgnify:CR=1 FL=1|jgi:hypothetical protein|nr:hypothetical protein [Nanoarchaeota archaeon]|tara:strand:- start:471 stop:833 length:363 start_codon:yes stop_codon:yes gene_type:complete